MNTPAHVVASLLVWRKESRPIEALAVSFGAILPDITMFVFFGYKLLVGVPVKTIFQSHYFLDHWQLFFDLFNSIPIYLVLAAFFYRLQWRVGFLVCASALLHCVCDFPLHHDDAHRHFLPLTHWRFESPVSYWDENHFGYYIARIEFLATVVGSCWLLQKKFSTTVRIVAGSILTICILFLALIAWVFLTKGS